MCGELAAARFVHVPRCPARSHATQEPVHAVSQHTPSGEQVVPETHPPATVLQVCPCLLLHAPDESHVPAHRPFGSSMPLAGTHAWVDVSHFTHEPVQSLLLQHAVMGMQVVVEPTVQDFVDPEQA